MIRYLSILIVLPMLMSKNHHEVAWAQLSPISPELERQPIVSITLMDGRRLDLWSEDLSAASRLDPHLSREEVVQRLIEVTLLADEAKQRGFATHPIAVHELNRAAVRRFVSGDFEEKYRYDRLPTKYIEAAKRLNMKMFRHPELRRGVHLLLKPMQSQSEPMTSQQAEAIQPVLRRIQGDLERSPVTSATELEIRRSSYQDWLPEGYEVIYERLGRFALKGRFHPDFTTACFQITHAPALVGPVKTPFGFHFIWLEEIIPALNTSDAEIDAEVKRRILPEVRGHEWRQLVNRLLREANIDPP